MTESITPAEYMEYLKRKKAAGKPSKYKNKRVTVTVKGKEGQDESIKFDSQKERAEYDELNMRVKMNDIKSFRRQVRYKLIVEGFHVCTYVADFVVIENDGKYDVIDVKSEFTRKMPVYRIKCKLMYALFGIIITEK